jgi:pimeloyl-ACP methyl ester carboxylesterase
MRLRHAVAAAATSALGAGAAVLAAGRYGSGLALNPALAGPAREGLVTVHQVTADRVVLTRTPATARPAVYGLSGAGVHATVGEVTDSAAHPVTRRLLTVGKGELRPGAFVRIVPQAYTGDPRSAFGLDAQDVEITGELGLMPAWRLSAARRTWVIAVHGVGATREQVLPVLPALHRFQLPVLVPAYRNDPGAPASPDGLAHLGDTEWQDLDAAMRYAVEHGALRLVLYGWSTGAAMALRALHQSPVRDRVRAMVLDSPVLDWRSTVSAAVRSRGLPRVLVPLAVRAAEGRTGLHTGRHAEAALPGRFTVPTLLMHGPDDTFAPWESSRELAERHRGPIALHTVPGAPHTGMWNADPKEYEETLRRFLTPQM